MKRIELLFETSKMLKLHAFFLFEPLKKKHQNKTSGGYYSTLKLDWKGQDYHNANLTAIGSIVVSSF